MVSCKIQYLVIALHSHQNDTRVDGIDNKPCDDIMSPTRVFVQGTELSSSDLQGCVPWSSGEDTQVYKATMKFTVVRGLSCCKCGVAADRQSTRFTGRRAT